MEGTTVFKNAEDYVLVIVNITVMVKCFRAILQSVLWLVKKYSLTMISQQLQKRHLRDKEEEELSLL